MSGLYKHFKTNADLEVNGVWLDYEDVNTRIRVARAGGSNKKFTRRLEALSRPHRRAIQADMMSNERIRKLTMEVFIDTVILDWQTRESEEAEWTKGISGPNGDVLEFTKDNVRQVLTELPELFDDIVDFAQKSAAFREEVLEAEAGN